MTTTAYTTSGSEGGGKGKGRPLPPEWAIEVFIKKIGRVPAAAGRALDQAAKVPVLGWVVRRFSSVWFGIILLTLIAGYIAIGSGLPQLRAHFEMTDLQFFDAWPMRVLLALLSIDLIVVTLRRIPLTLFKLGPWTVHVGIITLISGCVWYFSMKEEGAARMYLNRPVTYWYDVTERALYSFPMRADGTFDTEHAIITPIPSLPIFYEHLSQEQRAQANERLQLNNFEAFLADTSNPVDITLSGAIAGGGETVHISGYYPFADLRTSAYREAIGQEPAGGPAVAISLSTPRDSIPEKWLASDTPVDRLLEIPLKDEKSLPLAVEYLYRPSAERIRDLQASFEEGGAFTVRIPKLKIEKTYTIKSFDPIPIEDSPYTVTPVTYSLDFPMRSKGYENAHSSNLMTTVARKEPDGTTFQFQRMCLYRYPERSPDFVMEGGKQVRKQDGVDHDIDIIFHDATQTQAWIIEGADGKLSVIVRAEGGKSVTQEVTDKAIDLPVESIPGLKMQVTAHVKKAVPVRMPFVVPLEQRPRNVTAMEILPYSVIELEIDLAGGTKGSNLSQVHVPFVPYGDPDGPEGVKPTVVDIPGKGPMGLLLSTVRRELPTTVTLVDFKPVKFPGAIRSYMDYVSTLKFDDGKGNPTTQVSHLNRPVYDKGLIYFQSQWDGDDNAAPEKRFSVMGIANRPGLRVMIIGAILIAVGIGYAFYIKPLLLKYKKESLAAWNAARNT